jgi:hypothetical protein
MHIVLIPPLLIDVMWSQMKTHVDRAIKEAHGDMCEENLKARLRSGEELALAVIEDDKVVALGIITVRTLDTGRRVLYVASLGGDHMEDWFDAGYSILKQLEAQQNCDGIRACGRPGWSRKVPGARAIHQIIEF